MREKFTFATLRFSAQIEYLGSLAEVRVLRFITKGHGNLEVYYQRSREL